MPKEGTNTTLEDLAREINGLQKRTTEDVIKIGQLLKQSRPQLSHGNWGKWLHDEIGWSYERAVRTIHVAELVEKFKFDNFANLAPSVLELLSPKSMPPAAVDEAIRRAAEGERVTVKLAEEIIASHQRKAASPKAGGRKKPEIVKVETTPSAVAKFLRDNFNPGQVQKIYDAVMFPKKGKLPTPPLAAIRFVRGVHEILAPSGFDTGVRSLMVDDGWIFAHTDELLAGAPFPYRETAFVDGEALEWMFADIWDFKITAKGDWLVITEQKNDGTQWKITPGSEEEYQYFLEKRSWSKEQEPEGQRYRLPEGFIAGVKFLQAMSKTAENFKVKRNEIYLGGAGSMYSHSFKNPPWTHDFNFTHHLADFIAAHLKDPVEVMIAEKSISLLWDDGAWVKSPIEKTKVRRARLKE